MGCAGLEQRWQPWRIMLDKQGTQQKPAVLAGFAISEV